MVTLMTKAKNRILVIFFFQVCDALQITEHKLWISENLNSFFIVFLSFLVLYILFLSENIKKSPYVLHYDNIFLSNVSIFDTLVKG